MSVPQLGPDVPPMNMIYTCIPDVHDLCLTRIPGGTTNLTNLPESSLVTGFVVSPDNRWALYVRQLRGSFAGDLWRVSLSSGENQPVVQFYPPRAVGDLAWSPTGDSIAFIVFPTGAVSVHWKDESELWLISLGSSQSKEIIPANPDHTVGWGGLHWSRDGRFLFANRFDRETQSYVLYALDMSTRWLHKIAAGVRLLDQTQDGKRLLLASGGEGGPGRLWVTDWPASGPPALLTPEDKSDFEGRWSPDGTRILFSSETFIADTGGLASRLWLMNADGSHRQLLTKRPAVLPQWLPGSGDNYVLFLSQRRYPVEFQLLDVKTDRIWSLGLSVNWDYVPVLLP
jgi:Tol biopolymer transport system component